MKRLLWMLAVCSATASVAAPAFAQTNPGTVRLSWNSCDVVNSIGDLNSGATVNLPRLVISGIGTDIPLVGVDGSLFFGPNLPDSWRFDDTGCQTGSQLGLSRNALLKTCPSLRGMNPFPITFFGYDAATQRAQLRLLDTFDAFTPVAVTRYTWWVITFDHSFSSPNPTIPGTDCGEVDQSICIAWGQKIVGADEPPTILAQSGLKYRPTLENQYVSWLQDRPGCLGEVPTERSTWGRVKGLYR
jgi:hypothetical protein